MVEIDYLPLQIKNEEECYSASLDKYDKELSHKIETGSFVDSKEAIILFRASLECMSNYIDEYKIITLRKNYQKIRNLLVMAYPNSNNLSFMMLRVVLSIMIKGEDKVVKSAKAIGTLALTYIKTAILEDREVDLVEKLKRKYKRFGRQTQRAKLKSLSNTCVSIESDTEFVILLGTTLIDIIVKSGSGLLEKEQRTDAQYIRVSKEAMELLLKAKVFFGSLITIHYPFVVTPKPWTALIGSGGYYTRKDIKFIRTRSRKDFNIIAYSNPDLSRLYRIVNSIQDTPYRINKRVLEVMEYIDDKSIVDPSSSPRCPCLVGKIPYNEVLNPYLLIDKEEFKDDFKYFRALDVQKEIITRIKSKRISYDLALMIAKKFRDLPKIYFSYNTDFRGRLYPIQQYLNPQGTNVTKALLEFGKGEVLNEEGLYWLKIHGANCYGYDKLTYEERIKAISLHHEEIMAIHSDPISNIKYWYNVDSPLLYLAFCFSYGDYINDPNSLCYNVVHLDGTCSGIQMYSGLLLDKEGSEAVNVVNNSSGKISDIYGVVAKEVEELLKNNDYTKEYSFTTKGGVHKVVNTLIEAHSIKGKITRSLTKRNVMTQPYSVTRRGMFEQVYDLLQEYEEDNKVFWQGDKWTVSMLLSELNDKAIAKIVRGAKEGQKILKDVLLESLRTKEEAFWTTPIFNFPILQRIKREKRIQLGTPLGQLVIYNTTEDTHQLRMLNGIAPNFIHSLDSTLLYRTVELCLSEGVSGFWLIHDSYGVSPNSVGILNRAFRTAYIDLFSLKPLLLWTSQICEDKIDEVKEVMINTLDLQEVLNSNYIIT